MKRCPECRRDYFDDTLSFCLADGTELVYGLSDDEPATAFLAEPGALATGFSPSESPTRPQINTTDQTAISPLGAEAEPQRNSRELAERQSVAANRAAKPLGVRYKLFAGLAFTVLVLVGGFFGYRYLDSNSKQIESIAVMPFVNESGNADVEYLSDGMTETLIKSLSNLPNLNVKPRSSVFRYKGKDTDLQTIAKELNVQAILNGRVVQRGEQLTLSLELVDVQKDSVIWTEQYQRKTSDLVSLQSEIAKDVSTNLKAKLSGADETKVTKPVSADPEAYQAYLKGRYYWNRRTAENLKKAIEQFKIATDRDPNYALAFAGLADCYVVLGDYAGTSTADTLPRAKAFAGRALQLDESLAEAHAALAFAHHQTWDWQEAGAAFKRAIALGPTYPTARHWYYLHLRDMGRIDESLGEIKRAQELDPVSSIIGTNVGLAYLGAGDVTSAVEQFQKVLDLDPRFPRAQGLLGLAYLQLDRYAEGIAELEKALELTPSGDRQVLRDLAYGYGRTGNRAEALRLLAKITANYENKQALAQDVAAACIGLGKVDEAFAWLEKDFQARDARLARIQYQPPFEPIRDDLRYKDLLKRMGLPE